MKIFSYHKETGIFWFRILGKGLHFIDRDIHTPLFSRRNGYSKPLFTYKSWEVRCIKMKWELCGYCEFGYRLFRTKTGVVKRFPIPLVEAC